MIEILVSIIVALFTLAGTALGSYIQWRIAKENRQDKRRYALFEKRFEILQRAYSLLMELRWAKPEDRGQLAYNCQVWWTENNLYLDSDPRDDFYRAYQSANVLMDSEDINDRKKATIDMDKAFKSIEDSAEWFLTNTQEGNNSFRKIRDFLNRLRKKEM